MKKPAPAALPIRSRQFTQRDLEIYGELTGDYNPLHLDPEFAARSEFGHPIVYGTLALAPIWHAVEAEFGRERLLESSADARFTAPIKAGSSVTFESGLVAETASQLEYEVRVRREDGKVAASVIVRIARGAR